MPVKVPYVIEVHVFLQRNVEKQDPLTLTLILNSEVLFPVPLNLIWIDASPVLSPERVLVSRVKEPDSKSDLFALLIIHWQDIVERVRDTKCTWLCEAVLKTSI